LKRKKKKKKKEKKKRKREKRRKSLMEIGRGLAEGWARSWTSAGVMQLQDWWNGITEIKNLIFPVFVNAVF
jgi:hypothetical protein